MRARAAAIGRNVFGASRLTPRRGRGQVDEYPWAAAADALTLPTQPAGSVECDDPHAIVWSILLHACRCVASPARQGQPEPWQRGDRNRELSQPRKSLSAEAARQAPAQYARQGAAADQMPGVERRRGLCRPRRRPWWPPSASCGEGRSVPSMMPAKAKRMTVRSILLAALEDVFAREAGGDNYVARFAERDVLPR